MSKGVPKKQKPGENEGEVGKLEGVIGGASARSEPLEMRGEEGIDKRQERKRGGHMVCGSVSR